MKTRIALVAALAAASLIASPAFAAKKGTAEYDRLVALKKEQRAQREADKANPPARAKGFWEKEAERSGLAGTAAMVSNAATAPGRMLPNGKDSSK